MDSGQLEPDPFICDDCGCEGEYQQDCDTCQAMMCEHCGDENGNCSSCEDNEDE